MIDWLKQQFELWIEYRHSRRECQSCNTLREQLLIANNEKQKLLDTIVELSKPEQPIVQNEPVVHEALQPKRVPWLVRKQMLEKEDRLAAQLRKDKQNEINQSNQELENEIVDLEAKANV